MECWQFNVLPRTNSFTLREVAGVPVLWSRALMSRDVSPKFYAFNLTASVRKPGSHIPNSLATSSQRVNSRIDCAPHRTGRGSVPMTREHKQACSTHAPFCFNTMTFRKRVLHGGVSLSHLDSKGPTLVPARGSLLILVTPLLLAP